MVPHPQWLPSTSQFTTLLHTRLLESSLRDLVATLQVNKLKCRRGKSIRTFLVANNRNCSVQLDYEVGG